MKRELFLPTLLALSLRVALFIYILLYNPSFMIQPDSPTYINPAENLLEHGAFLKGSHPDLAPETVRTPGYPVFIALSYLLLGRRVESVIALQLLLGALFPILAWKTVEELGGGERVKRLAAWLSAFDPLLLIYTVNVLTEELYALMIALTVLLTLRLVKRPSLPLLLISSLFSSFQAFVRPVGLYLPFILFLYLALRRRFKEGVILLLISYALVFGWMYRNYRETGVFEFSTISGANMLFYRAAYVLQFETKESWVSVQERLRRELESQAQGLNEAEKLTLAKRMGFKLILSHPLSALKALSRGALGVLIDPGGSYYLVAFKAYKPGSGILNRLYELGFLRFIALLWRDYRYVFLVNFSFGLYFLFLYIASLWGLWRNRFNPDIWLLFLISLYFVLISAGPEAYSRFRVPFEILIIVLSSLGLERRDQPSIDSL